MYTDRRLPRNELIYQEKILYIFGRDLPTFEPRVDCTLASLKPFRRKELHASRKTEQNDGKQMAGTGRGLFLSLLWCGTVVARRRPEGAPRPEVFAETIS